MKRWISAALLSLLCLLLLCGCAPGPINDGETYLDGAWYFSDPSLGLNVGYNFFPDGGGYQFIGSTVNPIRYGVYEGNIYIAVGDGPADSFSFEISGVFSYSGASSPSGYPRIRSVLRGASGSENRLSASRNCPVCI
ncbi:MAG: hypothetical protein IIW19_00090 [Clostridia bacterium]|nr:hypothetical protein [Clostridia bacterium]